MQVLVQGLQRQIQAAEGPAGERGAPSQEVSLRGEVQRGGGQLEQKPVLLRLQVAPRLEQHILLT